MDLAWIFGENYLAMDPARRETCVQATADFLEEYYKDLFVRVQDRVAVPQRLRFHWIFRRDSVTLTELVRIDTAGGALPPTFLNGGRAYAAYPGFRLSDDETAMRAFQLMGPITGRLGDGTRLLAAAWEQRDGKDLFLAVTVQVPVLGDTDSAVVRLRAYALPKSVGTADGCLRTANFPHRRASSSALRPRTAPARYSPRGSRCRPSRRNLAPASTWTSPVPPTRSRSGPAVCRCRSPGAGATPSPTGPRPM